MRQIKFRGLRTDGKGWAVGHYVTTLDKDGKFIVFILPIDGLVYRVNGCLFGDVHEVRPDTVGQFTGLHDRNGVEVFAGDNFHMGDPNITYTVMWHDTGFMGKQNGSSSYVGLTHWIDRITITGNIHEK